MRAQIRQEGDVAVCSISGEVDITTSPELRKLFERWVKGRTPKVILNLKEVGYIDSSGLATLVEGLQKLKSAQASLKLTNLSGKVKSLFEITKLERLFEVFDEESQAIDSYI